MRAVIAAVVVAAALALWLWWSPPVQVTPTPSGEAEAPGASRSKAPDAAPPEPLVDERGAAPPTADGSERPTGALPGTRPPSAASNASPTPPPATGAGALLVPVQGVARSALLDTFTDARGTGRRHDAIDIMAPAGTPVVAVADGRVEKLFNSERGGLTIYQFDPEERFAYYYGHLQDYAPGLAEGQLVRRGQVIGTVGSSGNASAEAPHLHFAIFRLGPERNWWGGEPLNPFPFLRDGTAPK